MGSFTRFTRYIKDFWKVVIRGENDALQRQTVSMQKELARLRNRRMASDKEREAAALNQARGAVQRLRELHNSLLAAEAAASEVAAKMGDAARSSMEAHAETREQACKKFFLRQKELYQQEVRPENQSEMVGSMSDLCSQSNGRDEESKALESELNGPVDHKTCNATMGGITSDAGDSETSFPVVQGSNEILGEEVRQPNASTMPADVVPSIKNRAVDKLGFTEEIPEDVLAQMMQDVKKQVRLEEKSHLDALARDRAMLEKEIEARENMERASMSQGHR